MQDFQKTLHKNKIIILIIILASVLRFSFLDKFPLAVNVDEAAKGYNAYSLLKTGKSFRGLAWPLYFTDYSDQQPSHVILYNYLIIPSVALFGLNLFAIRFPAAIIGTLTVLVIYFLTFELFKKRELANLSALFLAISPWHIFMSRMAIEPITYPFLFLLGWYFAQKALKNKKYLYISAFIFGLCLYSYQSALLTIPVFLLIYSIINIKFLLSNKSISLLSVFIFILVASPLVVLFLTNPFVLGHFYNSSAGQNSLYIRIIELIKNYVGQLVTMHVFYPLPILLLATIGLWVIVKKRADISIKLIAVVAATSIIPAAATNLGYAVSAARTFPIVGILEILAALGFLQIKEKILKNKLRFITFCLINILFMFINVIALTTTNEFYFAIGFKEAVSYINKVKDDYDNIVINYRANQPFAYFLFYGKYPPEKFQNEKVNRVYFRKRDYPFELVRKFDKYIFCQDGWCENPKGKNLYLLEPNNYDTNEYKEIFPVYFLKQKVISIAEKR